MYNSQNYQQYQPPQQQPHPQSQPQSSGPPQQPPNQNHQPSNQPPYQGYAYPPHPSEPHPIAPTSQGYSYPPNTYPYGVPPAGYYYIPPSGYSNPYPGGQPPPYQSTYSLSPYPPPPSDYPPQYPPYNTAPPPTNGYHHSPQTQHYASRFTPGQANSPPSKRQKLEPRSAHSNGIHHKHSRSITKEKKTYSDFRVSKIKVGNFISDEIPLAPGDRDSRLRFYFRSGAILQPPQQPPSGSHDNLVAQFPDRLSVSLLKGTRRIVLPANHLSAVRINRREGYIKIEGDGWAGFEEIRPEEIDDSASTTSKSGYTGPKFDPSDDDPTSGEWAKCKIMEIWLDAYHPLTEPKWFRGNLRDNIDPTSLFQNIIKVNDINEGLHPATFDEMVESWRKTSEVCTIESRSMLAEEFTTTEKLTELLERIVHDSCPPFMSIVVERLISLVKDKETLQEDLKRIILGIPGDGIWRALNAIMSEDVDYQRETSRSAVSSVHPPTKREREEGHDEEMEIVSNDNRDGSVQDQSLPASAVDDISEPHETSVNVDLADDVEIHADVDIGMDLREPELEKPEASYPDSAVGH